MGAALGGLARSTWQLWLRMRFLLMNLPALLLPEAAQPNTPDTKATDTSDVVVYRHSVRTAQAEGAARVDFTTMLRLPDTRPPRFVLCMDRYANFGVDVPAEHCEVQFTGILSELRGDNFTLKCAHICLSDALDEAQNQKFFPCTWEPSGHRNWDGSVTLDFSNIRAAAAAATFLPPWLFDPGVPLTLQR